MNFIATETRPILGADFLTQYGLRLDMKNRQLTDPLANISVSLVSSDEPECTIRLAEEVRSDSFISKHCPSLLTAPDYSMVPNDVTEHCIETDGLPIFSKPRPIFPAKHEIAKVEFDTLIAAGIVRPSAKVHGHLHCIWSKSPMGHGGLAEIIAD